MNFEEISIYFGNMIVANMDFQNFLEVIKVMRDERWSSHGYFQHKN